MPNIVPVQFVQPNGLKAVEKFYGTIEYTELSGGNVHVVNSFERDNVVTLKNVCGTGKNIQMHRLVAPLFEHCLGEAIKRSPKYRIRMLGGYSPRHMRHDPKMPLSIHSWAAAFDVNWDKNPMGSKLITDLPPEFIAAFTEQGWNWGGSWKGIKDAMHFQYAVGC